MADNIGARPKGVGAWGQAVAALVLVGALALWMFGEASSSASDPSPAACSGGESEKPSRHISGMQLCEALNRPDLAELLGTPGEIAQTASDSDGSLELAGGKEIATPSARVEFETYTVTLSATYDRLPVAGSAELLGDSARQMGAPPAHGGPPARAKPTVGEKPRVGEVLGRPAVFYSDRTISINFRIDGSDANSGPGVPARALTVAQDEKDSGGSFDVTLWRADGEVPDDAVLLRVAEKVLPTVPGWPVAS
ncbi:DUF6215 domain-containing protein [Streptomyces ureilyticus]|uniref:Uncharacterized protein n=1 Tax=Streptomyces ureilyticus TaxID=1775131 RepID=A0ABX0DTT0_9ACTN|nr:DUF6215 domain-containing protein [Streptomyces ureilyticus]NGO45312.1 hypothetical protein [Streptomyces ureilyticus]